MMEGLRARLQRSSQHVAAGAGSDLTTTLHTPGAPLHLRNPIVAASGTFGYGSEFTRICPPSQLGAVTVKSLACFAHDGNPPLRTTEGSGGGMLNSVGLAGPGIDAWIDHELPALEASGATIIVSLWGRSIDDYAKAAEVAHTLVGRVSAIELNLSCPNLGGHEMFAQSATLTTDAVRACAGPISMFVKLTAQTANLVDIARAALDGGASGLTLINTMPGVAIDVVTRRTKLGAGGGGLSGAPLHSIALRAVADVHRALPDAPIIGTGGVSTGEHAVAMLIAGASAVGVGTATFAEPAATIRIRDEIAQWCANHNVARVRDIIGTLEWPT